MEYVVIITFADGQTAVWHGDAGNRAAAVAKCLLLLEGRQTRMLAKIEVTEPLGGIREWTREAAQ